MAAKLPSSAGEADATNAKHPGKTPKLQVALLVLLAVCFLINAMVNLSHAHGPDLHPQAALHRAMEDFKHGFVSRTKQLNSKIKSDRFPDANAVANAIPNAKSVVTEYTANIDAISNKDSEVIKDSANADAISNKDSEVAGETVAKISLESEIAKLSCEKYGGPSEKDAQEMVYWSDIPSDSLYVSPLRKKLAKGERRYMTFEPDGGGWNNIRMAMETVVGLAMATGRTLVLPPSKRMYLLGKNDNKQKKHFDFDDFFPMKQMAEENAALEMITMQQFLETEGMAGNLRDKETGKVSFPPNNRTTWEDLDSTEYDQLRFWLRTVALVPLWKPGQCLATFPARGDHRSIDELKEMQKSIHKEGVRSESYTGKPVSVDSPPLERMKENLAKRQELCVYNETMQNEFVVHFACDHKQKLRLLVHFYAFLFLEDWKEDLWMKRFMRDHMRYTDEIQCAAARVVKAMREVARKRDPTGNPKGDFDTFHVRRGDFQFKATRIEAEEIYKNSHDQLTPNATIFIATDERDKKFFDYLRQHYDIHFLDDFKEALHGVNTNYFGMIDQLVASHGRIFFGCWFSTFTGFINRIRGYRSVKDKLPGYETGALPTTYFYATKPKKFQMKEYVALAPAFFNREFPTSWRDIDKGVGELESTVE